MSTLLGTERLAGRRERGEKDMGGVGADAGGVCAGGPPPHSPALSLGLPPAPGHVNPQQVPRDHGLSRLQESER